MILKFADHSSFSLKMGGFGDISAKFFSLNASLPTNKCSGSSLEFLPGK